MVSVVHEDEHAIAFLDIQPMSRGHTLVVTKEHYPTLFDLPDELVAHCTTLAKRIAPGLQRAVGAKAINVFSANGREGGQDIMHFHWHLIPVHEGQPFLLQLPIEDSPFPRRADLDIAAARISRAIQDCLAEV